jgi:hypothetical protein
VRVKAFRRWQRKKGGLDWKNCVVERSGTEQFSPPCLKSFIEGVGAAGGFDYKLLLQENSRQPTPRPRLAKKGESFSGFTFTYRKKE